MEQFSSIILIRIQDWALVKTISVTERVKLWDQFEKPVDHESIKTEFLRKVHCKNPPFRFKLKPKPRHCAEIPPMVQLHYQNPPPLLPSLRDVLRCERVYRERGVPHIEPTENTSEHDTLYKELCDANEKLRALERNESKENLNALQANSVDDAGETILREGTTEKNDCMEIDENSKPEIEGPGEEYSGIVEALTGTQIPIRNDEKIIEKIENRADLINNTQSMLENHNGSKMTVTVDGNPEEDKKQSTKKNLKRKTDLSLEFNDLLELSEEVLKAKLDTSDTANYTPEIIDEQLNGLNLEVIKRLAFAQLQDILKNSPELVNKYQNETANTIIRNELKEKPMKLKLPSQMLTKDDIAMIAEQFALSPEKAENGTNRKAYAGVRRPVEPVPLVNGNCFIRTNQLEQIENDTERALAIARRLEEPLRESKIRARAVLTPVGDILSGKRWYTNSYVDHSVFMRYRTMIIGSGLGCDFQLTNKHNCARVSKHHATIFFDEVIKYHFDKISTIHFY